MIDEKCVGYIPMRLRDFRPALSIAAAIKPHGSFLDVGCGIGTKLLLAQRAGLTTNGIEIRPRYAAMAMKMAPGTNLMWGDVREIDVPWSAFDIVFCYSPLDEPDESELEARIAREMRPDAVCMMAYRNMPEPWRKVAPHVWVR